MVRGVRDIADHIRKSTSRRLDHVPSGEEMFKALCASALRKSILIVEQEMPNAIRITCCGPRAACVLA